MNEFAPTVVAKPLENDPVLGFFRGVQDVLASTARAATGEIPQAYAYATGKAVLGVTVEAPFADETIPTTVEALSQLATAQAAQTLEDLNQTYALHSQQATQPAYAKTA